MIWTGSCDKLRYRQVLTHNMDGLGYSLVCLELRSGPCFAIEHGDSLCDLEYSVFVNDMP